MIRKDLIEVDQPDTVATPYVLECHLIGDRPHAWRSYCGLWEVYTNGDARTRALSILDAMSSDTYELYDGWRVIRVMYFSPEVGS